MLSNPEANALAELLGLSSETRSGLSSRDVGCRLPGPSESKSTKSILGRRRKAFH